MFYKFEHENESTPESEEFDLQEISDDKFHIE